MLGFAAAVQVRANQDSGPDRAAADRPGAHPRRRHRAVRPAAGRGARPRGRPGPGHRRHRRVPAALEEARDRARDARASWPAPCPATGPGIEFTISDPDGEVGPTVLLDALQELRDAGAEAVEISTPGARGPGGREHHLVDVEDGSGVEVDGTVLEAAVPVPGHRRVPHPGGRPGHPRRRARRAAPARRAAAVVTQRRRS